jgi:hypothetical protein
MTANELADWIENGAPFGDYETAKQASAMLRQQQAEIESLRKELQQIKILCGKTQFVHDVHDYSSPFIELQKAREK